MPPKRKRKAKNEPEITIVPAEKPAPQSSPLEGGLKIPIRCVWDSRLIIGADKTITGTRYEFENNQVQSVDYQDYQLLLLMKTKPFGCCGGTVRPQKYFEEA